jgi:hypothetical protein
VAALLAVIAAILIAISTNGDFQRKWQANRTAAAGMESLAYDLLKADFNEADRTRVVSKIQELSLKRNQEIVGDATPSATPKENKPEDKGKEDKGTDKPANTNSVQ